MKKALLICTNSSTIKNFRIPLIKALIMKGYKVGVVALDSVHRSMIEELGVDYFYVDGQNRSLNPFKFFTMRSAYIKIIKEYKPEVVLSFMLKPNVLGAPVAKKLGVKKVIMFIDGLGDVFILNTIKFRIIRIVVSLLYKHAFKNVDVAVFSNGDDEQEFLKRRIAIPQKCKIIKGVGVDLDKFAWSEVKNPKIFLMVARLLKTKGVLEYCECARIVKNKYPEVEFRYLGGEGTLKVKDIKEYIDDGSLIYMGEVDNVKTFLEECGVFVLPSYREGLPVSVMEAEAIGRAIIASNCAGCKETVIDGYNGFLIDKCDVKSLVEKVEKLANNPELVKEMGENSRRFVEEHFNSHSKSQAVLDVIEEEF